MVKIIREFAQTYRNKRILFTFHFSLFTENTFH